MTAKEIGDMGEKAVLQYYLDNGYVYVDKNYHSPYGEIDIIVKNDEYIVFAEVKTRKNTDYGTPAAFVGKRKQKCVTATAAVYLSSNPIELQPRFDVVEVVYGKGNDLQMNHIENAFFQGDGEYAIF